MVDSCRNIFIIPTAVIILSLVLFGSCSTSKTNMGKLSLEQTYTDSTKEFVPLHPPVVILHSWRETK